MDKKTCNPSIRCGELLLSQPDPGGLLRLYPHQGGRHRVQFLCTQ